MTNCVARGADPVAAGTRLQPATANAIATRIRALRRIITGRPELAHGLAVVDKGGRMTISTVRCLDREKR
jgi:hypothetical protein